MRLSMNEQMRTAATQSCIWISPMVGLVVTLPVFWSKKKFLPVYQKLLPEAMRSRGTVRRRLVSYTVAQQLAVIVCILLYPLFLERLFGARGLFDMIPGYSTCMLLYVGGLVLGLIVIPRWMGVPLGWPATNEGGRNGGNNSR